MLSSLYDTHLFDHAAGGEQEERKTKQQELYNSFHRAAKARHFSPKTEKSYWHWVRRYFEYHKCADLENLYESHINAFLTQLAVHENVSASTQNQALSALLFMYRHVIEKDIDDLGMLVRANKPKRLPLVLTKEDVRKVISGLSGYKKLVVSLLYGTGTRLMECLTLRIKDVDLLRNEILVRDGKGSKDRVTMLPVSVKPELTEHLKRVKSIHQRDLTDGWGLVRLPYAIERKYPHAATEWSWQWVFPQKRRWKNPQTG